MGPDDSDNARGLSPRQQKWFATSRATLERETGKTLDAWIAIAKTCPETKPMARIAWIKEHHGLGMNRANIVMSAAFPSGKGWDNPDQLRATLWADPGSAAILAAVEPLAAALPGAIIGQRKTFTAYSREFQFASIKPIRGGKAYLGLAVTPDTDPRLEAPKNESWSERLKSKLLLTSPTEVDASIDALLKQAWEKS